MAWIIESRHTFTAKDGTEKEMVSYFDHQAFGIMNCMLNKRDKAKAKQFDTKGGAQNYIQKFSLRGMKPVKLILESVTDEG